MTVIPFRPRQPAPPAKTEPEGEWHNGEWYECWTDEEIFDPRPTLDEILAKAKATTPPPKSKP